MSRALSTNLSNIDEEKVNPYLKEFEEAQNEDNVKNIALMGAYGSGKSTILLKLKEQNPSKYININMIEFSDSNEYDNSQSKTNEKLDIDESFKRQEKIEKVEQSIIQQLIYQESQKTLPFSKIKREYPTTLKTSSNILIFLSCILSIILFCSFNCINYIVNFNKTSVSTWLSLLVFVALISSAMYLSFNIIYYFYKNFRLSKITFTKNSTNFECERYESVYNKFLDELIYFFKETSYDTVIFEDIDRYNDLLFFSHLRELNSLLNNSKYLNKKIRFIYAIKDDLFQNQDKHKFFDYIIPVVPIVDYTNSLYKFKEYIKDGEISDNALKILSLYVSDLRTIKNICNEYDFYKKLNNVEIYNNDSLLSVLVLKNLYPHEFAKLQYNESIIDAIFEKKEETIKQITGTKQLEIEHLTRALKDKEYCLDPKYTLLALIRDFLRDNQSHFNLNSSFKIKGLTASFSSIDNIMNSDVDWDVIKNTNSLIVEISYYSPRQTSLEFSDYLKERIKDLVSLHNDKELVKEKYKHDIMNKIDSLEAEVNEYTNIKACKLYLEKADVLEKLLKDYKEKNESYIDEKFIVLIKQLITQDLINESYSKYISLTYKNNSNETDLTFIRNVYSNVSNDFNTKLTNIEYIFSELKNNLYENPASFNYDIVKFFAENNRFNLSKLLKNNSSNLEKLFTSLDCNDENFETISTEMFKANGNLIAELISNDDNSYKSTAWIKILLCLDCQVFSKINLNSKIKDKIKNYDLIKLSKLDQHQLKNLTNNLKSINITFNNISGCEQNVELLSAIISNSLFKFDYNNLQIIDKELSYTNFTSYNGLIDYVNKNINEFVKILVVNRIQTNQPQEFYNYIISTVTDTDLIVEFYTLNPVLINDVSIVKDSRVILALSKNNENALKFLQSQTVIKNVKIEILKLLSSDFIEKNSLVIYKIVEQNSLYDTDLTFSNCYEDLLISIESPGYKNNLIEHLLSCIDNEAVLLRLLKAYNSDFRKLKQKIVLIKNDLNIQIINKLKIYDLFEIEEFEDKYALKKKPKSPILI